MFTVMIKSLKSDIEKTKESIEMMKDDLEKAKEREKKLREELYVAKNERAMNEGNGLPPSEAWARLRNGGVGAETNIAKMKGKHPQ